MRAEFLLLGAYLPFFLNRFFGRRSRVNCDKVRVMIQDHFSFIEMSLKGSPGSEGSAFPWGATEDPLTKFLLIQNLFLRFHTGGACGRKGER